MNKSETVLHAAVRKNDVEFVKLFIDSKIVDIDATDNFGHTPLHIAIFGRNISILEILLKNGANIHEKDKNCKSPLQLSVQLKLKNISKLLIIHGAGKNETSDHNAFHEAVGNGNAEIVELLINEKSDMNCKSHNGIAMVHFAASKNYEMLCLVLLRNGADPNIRDNEMATPIHVAAFFGYTYIVRILLEHGADPNAKESEGNTPLIFAVERNGYEIAKLLIEHGANLNGHEHLSGYVPIHLAVAIANPKVLMLLIENGASIDYKSYDGKTALIFAIRNMKMEMAEFLIEHGANVNIICKYLATPLHYAMILNFEEFVVLLLRNGASLNAKDLEKRTPIEESLMSKRMSFFKIIVHTQILN